MSFCLITKNTYNSMTFFFVAMLAYSTGSFLPFMKIL